MKNRGLVKIISGGQTGVDQAGLRAAQRLGLPTGGWIPKGFRTEDGDKPSLGLKYNLEETEDTDYRWRNMLNIRDADGTLIFKERDSNGSDLTITLCKKSRKPYWINPTCDDIRTFIDEYDVAVLNIAGNRESVSPGIGDRVENLLVRAIGNGS